MNDIDFFDNSTVSAQAKGGKARAKKLSPENRRAIAKDAAEARWSKDPNRPILPRATHAGHLHLGNKVIECAVLENGTRVINQTSFLRALGRSIRPTAKQGSASFEELPAFLPSNNLKPFITKELRDSMNPIVYKSLTSGYKGMAYGYRAEILPMVCYVYLDAEKEGELLGSQEHMARAAEIIVRGLATVGVIALIDEATGYQEIRDRLALQKILEAYISKELAAWAKCFPDEFYKELFRLRGWVWKGMSINRPMYVGKLTNDLVYERIAPGILDELKRKNPKTNTGYRKHRFHQWLTEDVGHPALAQHLYATIALMKIANDWPSFHRSMNRAFPKKNDTIPLALPE